MNPPLTTSSLLEFIRLFEHSSVFTDNQGQRLFGVPMWYVKKSTLLLSELAGWSTHVGYANVFPAKVNHEIVFVDVEDDKSSNRYFYRSPDTFRKCPIEVEQLTIINISEGKLLHYLANLFDVPASLQTNILYPAIHETLWRLGKTRIAGVWVDLWCARHVTAKTAMIFQHLKNPALPEKGLVLTLGASLPDLIAPPRHYQFLALRDLLVPQLDSPVVDRDRLNPLLGRNSSLNIDPLLPIRFDAFSNTLVITTKSLPPWPIKGARQQAVVRYLFDQLHKNRRWIPSHEILGHVYSTQHYGHSRRISDIFRGNLHWKDYIVTAEKGLYGFHLD